MTKPQLHAVPDVPEEKEPRAKATPWLPWLAAAAMLVLAVMGWSRDTTTALSVEERMNGLLALAGVARLLRVGSFLFGTPEPIARS